MRDRSHATISIIDKPMLAIDGVNVRLSGAGRIVSFTHEGE